MSSFNALKCDFCGGNLVIDDSREFAICEFCGTKYMASTLRTKIQEISGSVKVEGAVETKLGNDEKERLLKNAETYINLGQTKKAETVYDELINMFPDDYRVWWGKFLLHPYKKEYDYCAISAIKLNPTLIKNYDSGFKKLIKSKFIIPLDKKYKYNWNQASIIAYNKYYYQKLIDYIQSHTFSSWKDYEAFIKYEEKALNDLIDNATQSNNLDFLNYWYTDYKVGQFEYNEIGKYSTAQYLTPLKAFPFHIHETGIENGEIINDNINLLPNITNNEIQIIITNSKYASLEYIKFSNTKKLLGAVSCSDGKDKKIAFAYEDILGIVEEESHNLYLSEIYYQIHYYKLSYPYFRTESIRKHLGKCRLCGGAFKGIFTKICTQCGKPKDY